MENSFLISDFLAEVSFLCAFNYTEGRFGEKGLLNLGKIENLNFSIFAYNSLRSYFLNDSFCKHEYRTSTGLELELAGCC